jgi:hypothetical protein
MQRSSLWEITLNNRIPTPGPRLASRLSLAAVALILVCPPAVAGAAQVQPAAAAAPIDHTVATNLPGVRAFIAPPASFNPLTASDAQLAAFGFPPRPGADSPPRLYAKWAEAVTSPARSIVPTLVPTSVENGPRARASHPASAQLTANTVFGNSSNWSGYSVVDGARPFQNEEIYAQYTVPVAQQAFGACTGGWDYGSAWDGIDGNGSSDVLQAGIEFDAFCNGSTRATLYSSWYEWAPLGEVRIGNLPVAPGDVIRSIVWNTSPTVGHADVINYTTNEQVRVQFNAPRGTSLDGNSVEWIVERPTVGGSLANLTNYVGDPFTFTFAFNTAGTKTNYYYPGSNPTGTEESITMDDNSGNAISISELQGFWDLWFYNEGSSL